MVSNKLCCQAFEKHIKKNQIHKNETVKLVGLWMEEVRLLDLEDFCDKCMDFVLEIIGIVKRNTAFEQWKVDKAFTNWKEKM